MSTSPLANFQISHTLIYARVRIYIRTYFLDTDVRLSSNLLLKLIEMRMPVPLTCTLEILFVLLKRQTDLKIKEVSTGIRLPLFCASGQDDNRCGWEKKKK